MGNSNYTSTDTLYDKVTHASRVIVPLSPISVFAARSPWANLEDKTFDEIAQWLKDARKVDMYPPRMAILQAYQQGEIDDTILERRLQQWLDDRTLTIPRAAAEQYGRNALKLQSLSKATDKNKPLDTLVAQYKAKDSSNAIHQPSTRLIPLKSTYIVDQNNEKLIDTVDYHMIKWCKLYLDDAQSGWTMPNRDKGLFYAWQQLIVYDPALTKQQRARLKDLPNNASELMDTMLTRLGIAEADIQTYLENHLLSLPGWAGMMLWHDEQHDKAHDLVFSYLAIRLTMEWTIVAPYLPASEPEDLSHSNENHLKSHIQAWLEWGGCSVEDWQNMSEHEQQNYIAFSRQFNDQLCRKLWLEAWEASYNQQLKEMLVPEQRHDAQTNVSDAQMQNHTEVQMAFCIDVRSEPFRKQIESAGPFETIGIAGFFGLPIEKLELGSKHGHPSLPVMNQPQHQIKEYTHEHEPNAFQQRKHILESVTYTFKKMKQNVLPSLLLPELSGPWLTIQMFTRSFVPKRVGIGMHKFYARWLRKPEDTALTLDYQTHQQTHQHHHLHLKHGLPVGFTNTEKVSYALQALKLMDLTSDFAPLVVMCGHGSQSANNPYAASLDCGACGGAASGFNAKVLAQLCNLPEVRKGLREEGINIPETTIFAAAEHQTSVDELNWTYVPELTEAAQAAFERIEVALPEISYQANQKRLAQLPNNNLTTRDPIHEVHRLTNDWSEIRPEWGLAKNAAFIIGQRTLTQNSDLAGRAFLHNYHWQHDEDGQILANIIAGPALVAQWINLQYYASTVAPHYYGSGSKTTQSVTAGIGVMQGNASDLLTGLPWQSVMSADDKMYHSPIRLLIVIQAPKAFIKRLLENDPVFKQKVENGWVRLASVDEHNQWEDWS
ncbi:DUF2309 domain-containing protein [Staphylococcus caeli]|uniref:DUF2309 domain-containing protein n=1 Tax=Staphylococcus caeli TaxID=2201815 RepID=UPI003F548B26